MNRVVIPKSTYIIIDDVGWWSGTDGSAYGEPYRTGIDRPHSVSDYIALDTFAKKLGVKPQVALIVGEWDRYNRLKNVPCSNWMLSDWDNSKNVGKHLDEAMEVLNQGNLCVAIHGLCHEYWEEKNKFTRAEFGFDRDQSIIKAHLDAFYQILEDNGFKGKIKAYVPPAFYHTPFEITKILYIYGIRYMSTVFRTMRYEGKKDRYILENGIINCDRANGFEYWYSIDTTPPEEIRLGFCGLHWPNLLHPDPNRYPETIERWVNHYNRYKEEFGAILAKDEEEGHWQTVYEKDARVNIKEQGITVTLPNTIKYQGGFYLHSDRELAIKPVRKAAYFYEYYIDSSKADGSLIKWKK